MKKVFLKQRLSSIFVGLFSLFNIGLVMAQQGFSDIAGSDGGTNFSFLLRTIAGRLAALFGNLNFTTPMNLTTLLLGFLLWMILYTVVKKMDLFDNNFFFTGTISLIVTVLAFIYIPDTLLFVIGSEYAALGATILTVMPFAIMFYFSVKVTPSLALARAAWIAFFIYYIGMFIFSWGLLDPSAVLDLDPSVEALRNANLPDNAGGEVPGGLNYYGQKVSDRRLSYWAYGFFAVVSLLMFFTIGFFRGKVFDDELKSAQEKIDERAKTLGAALDAGEKVVKEAAG